MSYRPILIKPTSNGVRSFRTSSQFVRFELPTINRDDRTGHICPCEELTSTLRPLSIDDALIPMGGSGRESSTGSSSVSRSSTILKKGIESVTSHIRKSTSTTSAENSKNEVESDDDSWGKSEECIGDTYTWSGVKRAIKDREDWLGISSDRKVPLWKRPDDKLVRLF
ncbi:uncharacterized protein IL334_003693 [Kwoniella shivajii]|uniref:Uncharacterized protein n=1 Tax=Kwoniella shivajii TaxID=564305 RepID=A0ABZ1CY98_9TREE|nr:hypothetical protein IL334_003693 [Kwoniella shivajii]